MKYLFVFLLSVYFNVVYAQKEYAFIDDLDFLIHLTSNKLFNESDVYFKQTTFKSRNNIGQLDSLNYMMGFVYYQNDSLKRAKSLFRNVSENSPWYFKSNFYHSYICMKLNQPDSSVIHLSKLKRSSNEEVNQFREFQMAGAYLLSGDVLKCDSLSKKFNSKYDFLRVEQNNLIKYSQIHKSNNRKSPLIAALFSAFLPGLGKVYAGNNAQGLSAFLRVGVLGVITAENYMHRGIRDPQTIFFASLFSAFYIGNIWGSALSVQIIKTEKDLENKSNILVGIHMPLRELFN